MKKYLGLIISLIIMICPLVLKAAEKEKIDLSSYNTTNLIQTLDDEEIARGFSDYEETDDQVTIYLFRGRGCPHCQDFLKFLNNITTEYGREFKLVSFESWYDANNSTLLDTISAFLGKPASGVPYIIIGDKSWGGYASQLDDEIKQTLNEEYNSNKRYDVFEEYNNSIDEEAREKNAGFNKVIWWNFFFFVIATTTVMLYIKSSNKKLLAKIEELNKKSVVKEKQVQKKQPTKKNKKK